MLLHELGHLVGGRLRVRVRLRLRVGVRGLGLGLGLGFGFGLPSIRSHTARPSSVSACNRMWWWLQPYVVEASLRAEGANDLIIPYYTYYTWCGQKLSQMCSHSSSSGSTLWMSISTW